jgi:uncharacterized delta-60 repeat protein
MKKSSGSILGVLLVLALAVGVKSAGAAAGHLDTSFGTNGVTVLNLGSSVTFPNSVLVQEDGEILALVDPLNTGPEILRFTSKGALDTTFGSNGVASVIAESMMLQPNGQIVIGGVTTDPSTGQAVLGVERLNSNGTQDTFFGNGGIALASFGARAPGQAGMVLVETNGDILVGTQLFPTGRRAPTQTALARFTSSGLLDTSFGSQGVVIATAAQGCSVLAELASGEILDIDFTTVAQLTANGSVEPTVTGGTIVASNGSNIDGAPSLIQPNGDYLFATQLFVGEESRGHNSSVQVLRFTETGAADASFADPSFHFQGPGGSGIEAIPNSLALQSDGDIVVVGGQSTLTQSGATVIGGLARLAPNGDLDPSFGNGGLVVVKSPAGAGGVIAVAIQPADGKIVTLGIANNTELVVSRYLAE